MAQVLDMVMIDTVTGEAFKGNPTPVFILEQLQKWPADGLLQTIARELNQSETIFVMEAPGDQRGSFLIRSFTPLLEEPFCGHGIVGAAIALNERTAAGKLSFRTVDGILVHVEVAQGEKAALGQRRIATLHIPAVPITETFDHDDDLRDALARVLEILPSQIASLGRNALLDLVVEVDPAVDFSAAKKNIDAAELMKVSPPGTRSQIITSAGLNEGVDFLKRVFAYGSEDQATGSTHCVLAPYWGAKLGKSSMKVKQVSARTGEAEVENIIDQGHWVKLTVSGVTVMEGKILVPGSTGRASKL